MLASLKLRHLLIGLFGLLATIAFVALGWNLLTAHDDLAEAEWINEANTLGDIALRASTEAGMERGLAVVLLSHSPSRAVRADERAELAQLRENSLALHETLLAQLRRMEKLDPGRGMRPAIEQYQLAHKELLDGRAIVDACLQDPPCTLTPGEWTATINRHINALAAMRRTAQSSHKEQDHPYADNPLTKEVLFTLAEYAGRERALVGGVIAEGRPLTVGEFAAASSYRGVINETLQKIETMARRLPDDRNIAEGYQAMQQEYLGRFEALRQQVYDSSARGEPYPVSSAHWFHAATTAINSIVALSEQFGAHARKDIREIQTDTARNVRFYLAAAILVLLTLTVTLFAVRQRALHPLRRLEQAAHTIAKGNLQQPLTGFKADELGEVAAAFETMRTGLLAQTQERKRAEVALQASMQRFRSLVENLSDVIWEVDREGHYTYISPQVRALLGYEAEEVLGKTPLDLMPAEEAMRLCEPVARLLAEPESFQGLRNTALHRAGHRVELETSGVPIFDAKGTFVGYRGVDRDITWRLAAEEETARMLRVIEQTDDIVIITDPQGLIQYVNAAFERVTGYTRDEAIGQHTRILKSGQQDAAFYRELWRTITSGESFHANMIDRRRNGEFFRTEKTISPLRNASGAITHYVCTAKDVTERHHLNEQLQQSEKLASIGQLAAGVAHEINNPVGYINSNINTLTRYIEELFQLLDAYAEAETALADPVQVERLQALKKKVDVAYLRQDILDLINESGEGVRRVKKIVQDLKDFSRQDAAEWQMADLHQGLESTLNIVHNELKYKAEVIREFGDLPQIECVPSQLNQVFMNLLVNASHAIEERGTIAVRTRQESGFVWVEVEDTGKGIAPEHIKRIFEPFFTTKPVGKGTGLGLSLSYGIVQKHGGHIDVDSVVGKGTRFRIWLPVQRASNDGEPGALAARRGECLV